MFGPNSHSHCMRPRWLSDLRTFAVLWHKRTLFCSGLGTFHVFIWCSLFWV